MRYVRDHGYPAPEVVSVDGADLVLERAKGSTMRVDLARRPWMFVRHARLLADLHRRLHGIAAPEWLPAIGPGGAVIHLDLHPENVMLHGNGALVIDWANARAGHWPRGLRPRRRARAPAGRDRASPVGSEHDRARA